MCFQFATAEISFFAVTFRPQTREVQNRFWINRGKGVELHL